MAASQFDSPATLKPDGTVAVSGGLDDSLAALPAVEVRFLLVQGDIVIQGSGQGSNDRWEGVAPSGQGTLQAGSVVAVGLAFGAALTPQPGFLSTPWSEQIDLISPS
jgi:hypothetical protein